MACLISITHFTSHQTLIQKNLQVRCPNSCRRVLSSSTCLTGIGFVASKTWGEELRCMKRCSTPDVAHFRRYCGGVFVDYKVVWSSSPRVISGFWVGPDVEDGWGFVEAVVNQISDF